MCVCKRAGHRFLIKYHKYHKSRLFGIYYSHGEEGTKPTYLTSVIFYYRTNENCHFKLLDIFKVKLVTLMANTVYIIDVVCTYDFREKSLRKR